jgi:hypothetical protein
MPPAKASRAPRRRAANPATSRAAPSGARPPRPVAAHDRPVAGRGAATLSACGRYRYTLRRDLDTRPGPTVAFVMLNPSTADAATDDPTLRRVQGFARRLGAARLLVVNLFAWRATSPRALAAAADPVGPKNRAAVRAALRAADHVIAAWGAAPPGLAAAHARAVAALTALARAARRPLLALATTQGGHPRHPLYLRATLTPRPWPGPPAPTPAA